MVRGWVGYVSANDLSGTKEGEGLPAEKYGSIQPIIST